LLGPGAGSISATAIKEIIASGIEEVGKENLLPEDIIIMNVPFITGQHLNNVAIYKPVFFKDKLVGFPVASAHWLDLGGSKIGLGLARTLDVYQEGCSSETLRFTRPVNPIRPFFGFFRTTSDAPI